MCLLTDAAAAVFPGRNTIHGRQTRRVDGIRLQSRSAALESFIDAQDQRLPRHYAATERQIRRRLLRHTLFQYVT